MSKLALTRVMVAASSTLSDLDSGLLASEQKTSQLSPRKTSIELERIILDEIRRTQRSNKLANSNNIPAIIAKRHGLDPQVISMQLNDMIVAGKINNITYRGKKSFRIPSQHDDLVANDLDTSIQADVDAEDEVTGAAQTAGTALHINTDKLLSEQREFVSKLSDENISLKLRISELENEKFKNFSDGVVRPRNTVNNEFSTLQSPPSAYASKDSSSSASKAPSPPSQNTIQAQLIQCLQDRIDSLERQLNQKQHIIELLICEPATRKMHTNDTLKCSRCEVNSNSESTNKGKSTIAKNTSIVEESIFLDLTETIKNEITTAKKKKGRKRKQNKRKDPEPEKQTTTAKEKASNQENFITSNENTGDENKNSKNNKSAVNKNKNQAQAQATLFDYHSNNSNIIQNNPQKSDLETTTTTQSNDRSTASSRKNKGKHKIIVAGDSMVKNIKGWALKKRLNQNEDILIYSFPGATVNDMHR